MYVLFTPVAESNMLNLKTILTDQVDYIGLGPISVSGKTSPLCIRKGETPQCAASGRLLTPGSSFLYQNATPEDVGPMGALTAPSTPDVIGDQCREGGESALGMVEKVERIKMPRLRYQHSHITCQPRSGRSFPPLSNRFVGGEELGENHRCNTNFNQVTRSNTAATTKVAKETTRAEATDVTLLSKAMSEMCLTLDKG